MGVMVVSTIRGWWETGHHANLQEARAASASVLPSPTCRSACLFGARPHDTITHAGPSRLNPTVNQKDSWSPSKQRGWLRRADVPPFCRLIFAAARTCREIPGCATLSPTSDPCNHFEWWECRETFHYLPSLSPVSWSLGRCGT